MCRQQERNVVITSVWKQASLPSVFQSATLQLSSASWTLLMLKFLSAPAANMVFNA